ncbi:Gfo/Idh/MocA family protein [Lacibacterium aquatile]|uniref:Gfo/Idh/MocA family protein n=1 Tax=Lacibacterium aquatile TaxID=1168082 RepID=A0ABW5DQ28_9PROT
MSQTLRIGLVGSGFIARFHLTSMVGVRNVEVAGIYSRSADKRESCAAYANELGLGPAKAFDSLEAMLTSGTIDAVWILSPNDTRLTIMREIHALVTSGKTKLKGVACEKPLARTIAEAKEMVRLVEDAKLLHGYLENQVFSNAVARGKEIIWRRAVPSTGRPYLARAAEEHSGPHEPWFWMGERQGGGVLSDMMCHSVEVARFILSKPGEDRGALKLKSASATIATLKWKRPQYVADLKKRMGPEVDFSRRPVEDFARGLLTLEDPDGNEVMIEATTSWAYVGAGLRINIEMLGPEYSMEFSSLNAGLKVFLSRAVTGGEGEDLVEKQNAEQGLMPVLDDEAGIYGYTAENRHMVESFRTGKMPSENFHDGLAVVQMLMALYRSAETGQTVNFPLDGLDDYTAPTARA